MALCRGVPRCAANPTTANERVVHVNIEARPTWAPSESEVPLPSRSTRAKYYSAQPKPMRTAGQHRASKGQVVSEANGLGNGWGRSGRLNGDCTVVSLNPAGALGETRVEHQRNTRSLRYTAPKHAMDDPISVLARLTTSLLR